MLLSDVKKYIERMEYLMIEKNKGLVFIHISVLLFGISGLFGKWLTLPPLAIVFGRVLFSSLFLLCIIKYKRTNVRLHKKRDSIYLAIMGIILAAHWITFYQSIQVSTVAIGLLSFSTFPIFTTFLEPYCFKEKLKVSHVATAFITFIGILCVIPSLDYNNALTQGVIWGVISGGFYALLSIMNRKYVRQYSGLVVAFYEQSVAFIILLPIVMLQHSIPSPIEIGLLIILGVLFTAISHTLFITGLKYVRTQTAGIISSLEPVYGVIFAAMMIGEFPSTREIIGGIIILAAVLYSSFE